MSGERVTYACDLFDDGFGIYHPHLFRSLYTHSCCLARRGRREVFVSRVSLWFFEVIGGEKRDREKEGTDGTERMYGTGVTGGFFF